MSLTTRLGIHMPPVLHAPGRGGTCWRKVRHETEAEAEVARVRTLESFERRGIIPAAPLEHYECPNCGGWHVGKNPEANTMDQANLRDELAKGGVVTVMLGSGFDLPADFGYHPAVHGVVANNCDPGNIAKEIPTNTKVLILTEQINRQVYEATKTLSAKRRLLYLIRKTPAALAEALKDIVPKRPVLGSTPPTVMGAALSSVTTEPKAEAKEPTKGNGAPPVEEEALVRRDSRTTGTGVEPRTTSKGTLAQMAPKGAIASLAKEADLEKSVAEEGRRLFRLAQTRGIQTTIGSITQAISNRKRTERRTATPQSIVPENLRVLNLFDETIGGLKVMADNLAKVRDYVETSEGRMNDMEAKFELLAQTFKDLTDAARPKPR